MLMKLAILGRVCDAAAVGQMAVGAGGKRLIFNRGPELCHDVLTHTNMLLEFIPPEWMNEFNNESLRINETFASHIYQKVYHSFEWNLER